MPRARYRHSAVAVAGKVYVLGGRRKKNCNVERCAYPGEEEPVSVVDVYDIYQGSWSSMSSRFPPAGHPAVGDTSAFVIGTVIYAVGGYDSTYTAQASTFKLDLSATTPAWTYATQDSLDVPRGDLCATSVGGNGYIFGGWTHTNGWCPALAAVEQFDPVSHSWHTLAADAMDRGDAACAAMHGHIYIVGGERRNCSATTGPDSIGLAQIVSQVEMFDPLTQTFEQLTPLSDRRFRFVAVAAGVAGDIYVFGGQRPLARSSAGGPPEHPVTASIDVLRHGPPSATLYPSGVTHKPASSDDDDDDDDASSGALVAAAVVVSVLLAAALTLLVLRERTWRAKTRDMRELFDPSDAAAAAVVMNRDALDSQAAATSRLSNGGQLSEQGAGTDRP
jgi:hypothetical protein